MLLRIEWHFHLGVVNESMFFEDFQVMPSAYIGMKTVYGNLCFTDNGSNNLSTTVNAVSGGLTIDIDLLYIYIYLWV